MKLINVLVISLFIFNLVTPVNKLFSALGKLIDGEDYLSCRIHFTKDMGIIFAVEYSKQPTNFKFEEFFKEIPANTFSESDDIIKSIERGFLLEYSDLGLLYYLNHETSPELKFFNEKMTVIL
jgi:hypothetical protein